VALACLVISAYLAAVAPTPTPTPEELSPFAVEAELAKGRPWDLIPARGRLRWWSVRAGTPRIAPSIAPGSAIRLESPVCMVDLCPPGVAFDHYELVGRVRLDPDRKPSEAGFYVAAKDYSGPKGQDSAALVFRVQERGGESSLRVSQFRRHVGTLATADCDVRHECFQIRWPRPADGWHALHVRVSPEDVTVQWNDRPPATIPVRYREQTRKMPMPSEMVFEMPADCEFAADGAAGIHVVNGVAYFREVRLLPTPLPGNTE
jgi:hypothetical protein